MTTSHVVDDLILELSDDRLILGHRLSEWCGHGPMLEEDIALTNIALDLIGHATNGLSIVAAMVAATRSPGTTADTLAFLREAHEFRNIQLVEQPNGDFATTMMRQFLFDAHSVALFECLRDVSTHHSEQLAAWAAKCHKEDLYHLRHSSQWILRLGDGTPQSHAFTQEALDALWRFTPELISPSRNLLAALGANQHRVELIADAWKTCVRHILQQATLTLPPLAGFINASGRDGIHTEHLSHLLAIMQVLPRAHPGAEW